MTLSWLLNPTGGLWIPLTIGAALMQTLRNVMQRNLTGPLGTVGATHVRFLFGLPFAVLSLTVLSLLPGFQWPAIPASFWPWVLMAALSQIAGTALMLAAMQMRSFVVATAYTKTEPVQVALFGLVFLGERLGWLGTAAVAMGTAGVLLMSWPRAAAAGSQSPGQAGPGEPRSLFERSKPALVGVASGAMFAIASVCFRGAILALGEGSFVTRATVTLVFGLGTQTLVLTLWLLWRSRSVLLTILRQWRPSMLAGFAGAAASQLWFLAFALEAAARVRTLALIEILFAQVIARRLFAQGSSLREVAGIVLTVLGVIMLVGATAP